MKTSTRWALVLISVGMVGFVFADAQDAATQQQDLSQPSPTATVTSPLGGPMPEQQTLPVNRKQIPSESKVKSLDARIARVKRALKSKSLTPEKGKHLNSGWAR